MYGKVSVCLDMWWNIGTTTCNHCSLHVQEMSDLKLTDDQQITIKKSRFWQDFFTNSL
jgi:hypothetical protein